MRPLAAAIARAFRSLRLDSDVAKADAMRAWTGVASAVIGPDATRTTALRMDEGTLVVAVPTADTDGWAPLVADGGVRLGSMSCRTGSVAPT